MLWLECLPFFGADLRSLAVLSRDRAFDGEARDEPLELLEYDEPDSDALESDDSEPDELDRLRRCSFSPPLMENDIGLRGGAGGGDGYTI